MSRDSDRAPTELRKKLTDATKAKAAESRAIAPLNFGTGSGGRAINLRARSDGIWIEASGLVLNFAQVQEMVDYLHNLGFRPTPPPTAAQDNFLDIGN